MGILKHIFIVALVIFVSSACNLFSQTDWYKYPGNPVFKRGIQGDWDNILGKKAIIYDQGMYHMWYTAKDSSRKMRMGYATSKDGIHWEKYHANPIQFEFDGNGWERGVHHLNVLKKDSLYYLWYSGFAKDTLVGTAIGLATSRDGIKWEILSDPVLLPGEEQKWIVSGFSAFSVLYHENKFHIWYTGIATPDPFHYLFMDFKIGYATSTDGIHWTKHPANPVLSSGTPGSEDHQRIMVNTVVFNGSGFDMWYSNFNLINWEIGHAYSVDGIRWINSKEYPVISRGELGAWDSFVVASPLVIYHDSIYYMWYNAQDRLKKHYGYATTSNKLARAWENDSLYMASRSIWVRIIHREELINIDSLLGIIPMITGVEQVDALNKLALAYSLNEPEKSLHYALEANRIAKSIDYPQGQAMALYAMGNSQFVQDNYTDALRNQLRALRIYDSLGMDFEVGNIYSFIASVNSYAGAYDMAIKYYQRALGAFRQINDTVSIGTTLLFLGNSYYEIEDIPRAMKIFRERLHFSASTHHFRGVGKAYDGLGQCYSGIRLDSALYFFDKAVRIWDSIKRPNSLNYTKGLIARAYMDAGPEYYSEAKKYYLEIVNYFNISTRSSVGIFYRLSYLEFLHGDYYVSMDYLDIALKLCNICLNQYDDRSTIFLITKLENERVHHLLMKNIYHLYYRIDTALHDKEKALDHYILASQWKDSIQDDESRKQWAMMQGEYETERAENKIVVLEKENEVSRMKVQQSRIYLFAMGAFILVMGLMALLFVRQNKIRAEHRNVLLEQKMLRLQMNPHFIFNSLSGIMEFIDNKLNETASKYLATFANLMRSTLESTRKDFIYLEEEVGWLRNYMELQKLRYADNFQYSIHVDKELEPSDVKIPPMLIQPFVENAIEHGIRHKDAPGLISVSFRLDHNMIKCEVEDDGVGRAKAWEIEHNARKGHTSMATDIIMDRIRAINRKLKRKVRLDIIDMISENNEPLGTKVILDMPYI